MLANSTHGIQPTETCTEDVCSATHEKKCAGAENCAWAVVASTHQRPRGGTCIENCHEDLTKVFCSCSAIVISDLVHASLKSWLWPSSLTSLLWEKKVPRIRAVRRQHKDITAQKERSCSQIVEITNQNIYKKRISSDYGLSSLMEPPETLSLSICYWKSVWLPDLKCCFSRHVAEQRRFRARIE